MSIKSSTFNDLSLSQLNELLEDDEKLNKMVLEMEEVQNVQLTKEMTLASNRSLAEQNLQYQPKLEGQKLQLNRKYQELQVLFEAYQMRKASVDKQSGNTSLDTLLALLQTEGAKIEEETENMADQLLDGDMTLDSFIDEYRSKRMLAHLRRVKIEKLQEIERLSQARLQQQPKVPETASLPPVAFSAEPNNSPAIVPRRLPPPPPPSSQTVLYPAIFTGPSVGSAVPTIPIQATPYPPYPPRAGNTSANQGPSTPYMSPYPPALPQRPPPRLPPQAGFILQ
ncbi:VPS37B subunit of ESCRT-I a [Latimeria chalumnae]|uniref:VPS37B subunit of ESCRT-I a n=1 Tax=Latimeria chalumnae TaxID=7897 RepID=UPI00313B4E69